MRESDEGTKTQWKMPTRRQFLTGTGLALGTGLVGGFSGFCRRSEKEPASGHDPVPSKKPAEPLSGMEGRAGSTPRPGTSLSAHGDASTPSPARGSAKGPSGKGVLFVAKHEHTLGADGKPGDEPMGKVLDWLVAEITGKSKPLDGWASLFKSNEIVAIKPNCFSQQWCAPAASLVRQVIDRLHRIGVPHSNILIWDHWNFAGSDVYKQLRRGPAVLKRQKEWGFDRKTYRLPTAGWTRFNKAITQADAIINMPVFKDHDLAGFTGAMKNLSHGSIINPASHHRNCCSPSIPEIYGLPMIKDKVRLIIADIFKAIYQGGPFGSRSRNYTATLNLWMATTDPVALDRFGWETLDNLRKARGLAPLMKRKHEAGKPVGSGRPLHIEKAEELGLGVALRPKIKVVQKILG